MFSNMPCFFAKESPAGACPAGDSFVPLPGGATAQVEYHCTYSPIRATQSLIFSRRSLLLLVFSIMESSWGMATAEEVLPST